MGGLHALTQHLAATAVLSRARRFQLLSFANEPWHSALVRRPGHAPRRRSGHQTHALGAALGAASSSATGS